ncbi:MAG: hypothetical protein IJ303_01705 [Clostridia bacterium]|nr:hypothetical protein [Clostridia bacterium]
MRFLSIMCQYNNTVYCNKKDFDYMYQNLDFDIVTPGEILALRFSKNNSIETDIFVKVISVKMPYNTLWRGVYLGNLQVELPDGTRCLLKKENDGDAHRVVSRQIASYYAKITGQKQTLFGISRTCSVISFKDDEDSLKQCMLDEKERQAERKRKIDDEKRRLQAQEVEKRKLENARAEYANKPLDSKKYKEIDDLFRKM